MYVYVHVPHTEMGLGGRCIGVAARSSAVIHYLGISEEVSGARKSGIIHERTEHGVTHVFEAGVSDEEIFETNAGPNPFTRSADMAHCDQQGNQLIM